MSMGEYQRSLRWQHYLEHLPCPHAVNSKRVLQVPFTSSIAEPELRVQAPGQTAYHELTLLWIRRYPAQALRTPKVLYTRNIPSLFGGGASLRAFRIIVFRNFDFYSHYQYN